MNSRDSAVPVGTDCASIEAEIVAKGKTAPRITLEDIERQIVSEHYFVAGDALQLESAVHVVPDHAPLAPGWILGSTQVLTFCVLQLRNGFTVTGESACASLANFDAEIGRKIAGRNARDKIWALEGYQLRTQLHEAQKDRELRDAFDPDVTPVDAESGS